MSRVSVSELKARLSHYLREVRRGGEVEVLDRGVPIARLSGIARESGESDDERLARLERAGVLRRGSGDILEVAERPPIKTSTSVLEALAEERADRV